MKRTLCYWNSLHPAWQACNTHQLLEALFHSGSRHFLKPLYTMYVGQNSAKLSQVLHKHTQETVVHQITHGDSIRQEQYKILHCFSPFCYFADMAWTRHAY